MRFKKFYKNIKIYIFNKMRRYTKKRRVVRRTRKHRGGINYGNRGNNEMNKTMRNYHRQQARLYGYRSPFNNNNNMENEIVNPNEEVLETSTFNIPPVPNTMNQIELSENAENAIMLNSINFTKPILNFNGESNHGRYYQNSNTLKNLKRTGVNPFTKAKISKAKWLMPKKK